MSEFNYVRDMYIDDTALDVEWADQTELAMKYGQEWADLKDELLRAEENVKLVRSQLIIKINKNPEKYLGEGVKVSDPKIEAAYRVHPLHIAAKEKWLEASKKFYIIDIAKNEVCFTRKSALENLVILHGQKYFAGPSVPRNLQKERSTRSETRMEKNKRVRIGKRT